MRSAITMPVRLHQYEGKFFGCSVLLLHENLVNSDGTADEEKKTKTGNSVLHDQTYAITNRQQVQISTSKIRHTTRLAL